MNSSVIIKTKQCRPNIGNALSMVKNQGGCKVRAIELMNILSLLIDYNICHMWKKFKLLTPS